MKKGRSLVCLLTGMMLVVPMLLSAQETTDTLKKEKEVKISLHLLAQGEYRDGGLFSGDELKDIVDLHDYAHFAVGRARLIVEYKQPSLEMKLTAQHQGVWGESGRGNFNIYEAWAKASTKNGFFVQIGRQALSYDDERIIGPNDWAMAASSHDALRLGYEGHGHKAHLILAYNQNSENVDSGGSFYKDGAQAYKTMQTLWYHYDVPRIPLGVSALFMNIGMQGGENKEEGHTVYQQLLGGYVKYSPRKWYAEASYYHQMGKEEYGAKLSGWMASVKAGWLPTETYKLETGFDYLSGDKYFAVPGKGQIGLSRHEDYGGFYSMYGSHHKFYGAMDFFYVSAYVNGFSPGLQNAYIGGEVKPIKNLTLNAYYHYMAMATTLENINKTLGHEIELAASYDFGKIATLSAGFSYMTGTKTMEQLKRASSDGSLRWGWITLNIKPTIFSTKW